MRPPAPGKARRVRALALAVLLAAFAAGALAGVAIGRVTDRAVERPEHRGRHAAAVFAPDGPLGERLALTADQRRQVEGILAEHGRDAEAILEEMRPRLRAVFERTTESIRGVLEPDQQAELDRYLAERQEKLRQRGSGPAAPHRRSPGGPR
jgi:hypothetical protein